MNNKQWKEDEERENDRVKEKKIKKKREQQKSYLMKNDFWPSQPIWKSSSLDVYPIPNFFHHRYGKNLVPIIKWWTEFVVKTVWMKKLFELAANIKNKFWLSQQIQRNSYNNIVIKTTIWRLDRICIECNATDGLFI